MQRRGKKIKRSTSLYGNRRRNKVRGIITIILFVITIAVLVFLGYTLGEPITQFFKTLKTESSSSDVPWSPSDVDESSSEAHQNSSHKSSTVDLSSDTDNQNLNKINGTLISYDAMSNEQSLSQAINQIKQSGKNTVIVPLKGNGGYFYYNTANEFAKANDLIKSSLSLQQIVDIIKANGMTAVGDVEVLNDSIYSKIEKPAGYLIKNSSSSWYDDSPQNGGKPWLSPYSETAKEYVKSISKEISSVKFDMVICSDIVFPHFRNSDANYLGDIVTDVNRYKALIDVSNILYTDLSSQGVKPSLRLSAKELAENTSEIYKPDELPDFNLIVECNLSGYDELNIDEKSINLSNIPAGEKVKTIFEIIKTKTTKNKVIPYISTKNYSAEQVSEMQKALQELGYEDILTD